MMGNLIQLRPNVFRDMINEDGILDILRRAKTI